MTDSTLFFIFISIAIFSYGIQLPLLIHFARKLDGITTTIYRNLSLAITMLPVLYFAPAGEIAKIPEYIPYLIGASAFGATGFILNLTAAKYLPIGISHSIRQASYTVAAILLGMVVFGEFLQPLQLIIIGMILAGVIGISLSKPDTSHLETQNATLGFTLAGLAGIGYASAFLIYSFVSREVSPLAAGYFWEVGVGLFAVIFGGVRYLKTKKKIPLIPLKDGVKIAAISLTTISGTLSYGFAVSHGHFALAASLITTTGLITLIAGYVMFKEKLTPKQVSLIIFVLAAIMTLRFVS